MALIPRQNTVYQGEGVGKGTYVLQFGRKTIDFFFLSFLFFFFFFCKKGPFKSVSRFFFFFLFYNYFLRISSENVPRMKVLIFADLIYDRIIITENTQAQYFDTLISNCTRVFSTITIR